MNKSLIAVLSLFWIVSVVESKAADEITDPVCKENIGKFIANRSKELGINLDALIKDTTHAFGDRNSLNYRYDDVSKYDGDLNSYFPGLDEKKKTAQVRNLLKGCEERRTTIFERCKNEIKLSDPDKETALEKCTANAKAQPLVSIMVKKQKESDFAEAHPGETFWPTYTVQIDGLLLGTKGYSTMRFDFDASSKGCPVAGVRVSKLQKSLASKYHKTLEASFGACSLEGGKKIDPDKVKSNGAVKNPKNCLKKKTSTAQSICRSKLPVERHDECAVEENWKPYLPDVPAECAKRKDAFDEFVADSASLCVDYFDSFQTVRNDRAARAKDAPKSPAKTDPPANQGSQVGP